MGLLDDFRGRYLSNLATHSRIEAYMMGSMSMSLAQAAPFRLERTGSGVHHWEIEPELPYGILPRTHVEVGPFAFIDAGNGERTSRNLGRSPFGISESAVGAVSLASELRPLRPNATKIPAASTAKAMASVAVRVISSNSGKLMQGQRQGYTLNDSSTGTG